jgi:RNA polymerase sigma-70 factor (ECF subfamily)
MHDDLEGALTAARRGDEQGFALLWRFHQPGLLRYLRCTVGTELAEDVASATWLDVARSLDRFEGGPVDFRGWLFTIARRRGIDALRAKGRRPDMVPLDAVDDGALTTKPDTAESVMDELGTWDALSLLATLSPDRREVLALRVLADLDVATVAGILGKQPGAVRVASHRGLRELAERLATGNTTAAPDDVSPG